MRKKGRVLLFALCTLALFLLVPALVDGPNDTALPTPESPLCATLFSIARLMESQTGCQSAPPRVDRPEGIVDSCFKLAVRPDVKADANGHPLRESTYIKAVYQAFRLEDKSG